MTNHDVFISYSRNDAEMARQFRSALESAGIKTWMDDDIALGENWYKAIDHAIRNARSVLVLLTPNAQKSEWIESEIETAHHYNKSITPVLLRGEFHDSPASLQSYLIIDARQDYDRAVEQVIAALRERV